MPIPKIHKYNTLSSTNSEMQKLQSVERLSEFSVVITSNQTSGRGQQGNFWESEDGKNLTFSIILYPKFIHAQYQFNLNIFITVALTDVLKKYIPNIKIKWTNDIYSGDNKLVGILIENSIIGGNIDYSIVGIGLNVNQINFISSAPNPVSMKQLTNKEFELEPLLQEILNAIILRYIQCVEEGIENIRKEYLNNLYRKDGFYNYKDRNGCFSAKIEKIDEIGYLYLVDSYGKTRSYAFKEVNFVI